MCAPRFLYMQMRSRADQSLRLAGDAIRLGFASLSGKPFSEMSFRWSSFRTARPTKATACALPDCLQVCSPHAIEAFCPTRNPVYEG
jgi:hypothetical protein